MAFLLLVALGLSVVSYARWRESERQLLARTDSADVVITQMVARLAAARQREQLARDSTAQSRAHVQLWRHRVKVSQAQTDSVVAWVSAQELIPAPVVLQLVARFHTQLAAHDSIIARDSVDILRLERLYAGADADRARLLDALDRQRTLTRDWQRVARPPLFSLRRISPIVGCVAGLKAACGVGVAYRF
jgi:hypothetical protein